jgi:thiol-disulfide isomerase/thioredoxin
MFTPDNSFKCINCGGIIKEAAESVEFHPTPMKKQSTSLNMRHFLVIVLVVGLGVLGFLTLTKGSSEPAANAYSPGEEMDIEILVHEGKTTIFDFYSDYCPPCRKISPLLKELDEKRDDIVVVKIDINRKGVSKIDFGSPLARQYDLQYVPYFIIYDTNGSRTHEGDKAGRHIVQLLYEEGIH